MSAVSQVSNTVWDVRWATYVHLLRFALSVGVTQSRCCQRRYATNSKLRNRVVETEHPVHYSSASCCCKAQACCCEWCSVGTCIAFPSKDVGRAQHSHIQLQQHGVNTHIHLEPNTHIHTATAQHSRTYSYSGTSSTLTYSCGSTLIYIQLQLQTHIHTATAARAQH
jgi:hypothetical protein